MTTSEQENESLAQAREVLLDAREVLAAEQQDLAAAREVAVSDREAAVASAEGELRERAAQLDALIRAADARDRAAEIRARSAEAREAAAVIRAERARLARRAGRAGPEPVGHRPRVGRPGPGRSRRRPRRGPGPAAVAPIAAATRLAPSAAVTLRDEVVTAASMTQNDHGTDACGCAALRQARGRAEAAGDPEGIAMRRALTVLAAAAVLVLSQLSGVAVAQDEVLCGPPDDLRPATIIGSGIITGTPGAGRHRGRPRATT